MHQATRSLEAHSAHKGPTPLSRHPAGGAAPPGITTPPFQLPLTALLTFLHVFNLTSTTKQPLPKHYQAHNGHYQAITKPTRAITNPQFSHYQAHPGHYQAAFGHYQALPGHYQAPFGHYQART